MNSSEIFKMSTAVQSYTLLKSDMTNFLWNEQYSFQPVEVLFKNFLVLQFICLFLPFLFQDIICDVIISVIHFSKFLEFIPLIATAFSLYTALNKENKTSTPPKKKAKTKRKIKPLLAHRRLAIRVFKLYVTIDLVLAHKILPAEISTHFIPTPAQHYSSTLCLFGGCLLWDS